MASEILFIHQSSDLYGSDKVLLNIVSRLNSEGRYKPIVVLPSNGPLCSALRVLGIEVYIGPVAKLERRSLSFGGFFRLIRDIFLSQIFLWKLAKRKKISLIYSNTLAVLSGGIFSFFSRLPHVWHVHELILAPRFLRRLYPVILGLLADRIICISEAVSQWILEERPGLVNKCAVVWNGIPQPLSHEGKSVDFRKNLEIADDALIVAVVGRINRWKGQSVFVDAIAELDRRGARNVHALIVGSAPDGQAHFLDALLEKVSTSAAAERIKVLPFTKNIYEIWQACDIAVVPSIEPEPFGLVAIEAMAAGRPVIGAAHGGLVSIVENGVTGLLVPPGNVLALADAIERMHKETKWRIELGHAGKRRQLDKFSLASQVKALEAVFSQIV